ncbi:hypothetical protein GCK32_019761 [Trichostrongylus colubriformis]|uniref:Uncharacterized protein n=1 Tax=Trichostrongylus colubriformis TaxID=6319 RepID=A0AAN8FEM9_TRICO
MTRKRKVDNTESENDAGDHGQNRSSEYGYKKFPDESPSTAGDSAQNDNQFHRTFPHKNRGGGGFRGRGRQRNHQFSSGGRGPNFDTNDFDRKYGRVGGGNEEEVRESIREEDRGTAEKGAYPAELVAYLKNIEQMIATEGLADDMVIDKCAEECSGEEEKLLLFRDSSIAVESVFGKYSKPFLEFFFFLILLQ